MRFTAIFPFLLCVAALVLSLLCLFAGSSKGFLQKADVLTVCIFYSLSFNDSLTISA
jgi:hypothetical protein